MINGLSTGGAEHCRAPLCTPAHDSDREYEIKSAKAQVAPVIDLVGRDATELDEGDQSWMGDDETLNL